MKRGVAMRVVVLSLAALPVAAVFVAARAQADGRRVAPTSLRITEAFTVDHGLVTVPHRSVLVKVDLPAFAVSGRIEFTAAIGRRVFKRLTLHHGVSRARPWRFTVRVAAPRAGVVTVLVRPEGKTKGVRYKLRARFRALTSNVSPGATGTFVELVQQRLAKLHVYIPQTGVYDHGTELALDTYHRLLGEGEGQMTLTAATVTDLLDGRGTFHVRFPQQGDHAEGDLSDQVLAFIDGSKVHWLFPISSGKPSTPTILGNFQVYRKQPQYTSDGMYFSSFFHTGYAIHGYNPAPDYPASHGCMRLPMVDAVPAYNWIQVGDWVDTYYT